MPLVPCLQVQKGNKKTRQSDKDFGKETQEHHELSFCFRSFACSQFNDQSLLIKYGDLETCTSNVSPAKLYNKLWGTKNGKAFFSTLESFFSTSKLFFNPGNLFFNPASLFFSLGKLFFRPCQTVFFTLPGSFQPWGPKESRSLKEVASKRPTVLYSHSLHARQDIKAVLVANRAVYKHAAGQDIRGRRYLRMRTRIFFIAAFSIYAASRSSCLFFIAAFSIYAASRSGCLIMQQRPCKKTSAKATNGSGSLRR